MVFFAHLLILQYPDHHQNLISSYLYYSGPVHKISSQSVHNFLSNVVHRQTNRQTDKLTSATKNITSFAKEVTRQYDSQVSITNYNLSLSSINLCTASKTFLLNPIPKSVDPHSNNSHEISVVVSALISLNNLFLAW